MSLAARFKELMVYFCNLPNLEIGDIDLIEDLLEMYCDASVITVLNIWEEMENEGLYYVYARIDFLRNRNQAMIDMKLNQLRPKLALISDTPGLRF